MDRFTERSVTYVNVSPPAQTIGRKGTHFFMGSCFAENLHGYFHNRFVDCFFSPFGNIYNPLSLAFSIKKLCSDEPIKEKSLFRHKGLWRHFDFDTGISGTSKEDLLNALNRALDEGRKKIRRSSHLYLSLGTSFAYRLNESGDVVNNCHTLPSSQFTRNCASIAEMREQLSEALQELRGMNRDLNIVITLSPVRHLRDDPAENSLSKARLRCLIDDLAEQLPLWYFPAYEIMLDQLRDYRWYGPDMTHPSDQAVEYIMERFVEAGTDGDFQAYLKETSALYRRLNHRILHPGTEEAEKFAASTKKIIGELAGRFPEMARLQELASY